MILSVRPVRGMERYVTTSRWPMSIGRYFAFALLCAVACSSDDGITERHSTRAELGDTMIVLNLKSLYPDTATLVLIRRYGVFDGPPGYELHDPRSFAVSLDGDIYVFDAGIGIKHFSATGVFEGLIARTGAGPREVGLVSLLASGPDGEIAAYDPRNGRVLIFGRDLDVVHLALPSGMQRYGEDGMFFGDDGSLWVGVNPLPGVEPVAFPRPIFARFNENGALVDTIFVPADVAVGCPLLSDGLHRSGFWEDKRVQWFPKVTWTMRSDGTVAYGCPSRYQLDVVGPKGAILRIGKKWVPVLTDPDEEAFYLKFWTPLPSLPRQRPAYARLILPIDGRLWVWPVQPSQQRAFDEVEQEMTGRAFGWVSGRRGAFDVFNVSGEWLGSVALPDGVEYSGYPDTRSLVIRGDTLWAVMRDELDVPYIGRFQVMWP